MNEEKLFKELNKIIYAKETLQELIEYCNLILSCYDNQRKRKKYIGELYLVLKKFNYYIKKLNKDFESLIYTVRSHVYQIYSNKKSENRNFFYDLKVMLEKLYNNVTTCKKSRFKKEIKKLGNFGANNL